MSQEEKLAPVISIINKKGGVGKTTTVINLAAEFARKGLAPLVVDLDPQGNASNHIGQTRHESITENVAKLFCDPDTETDIQKIVDVIRSDVNEGFEGVCYIASSPALDKIVAETVKVTSPRPAEELKYRLDKIRSAFDVILIDCPPTLTTLSENAISASTHYITPIDTGTDYSTDGWLGLMEHIQRLSRRTNPSLQYLGALLTKHDAQKNINKVIAYKMSELEKSMTEADDSLLPIKIRYSPRIGESTVNNVPVRKVPNSKNITQDYEDLTAYIIAKLELTPNVEEA